MRYFSLQGPFAQVIFVAFQSGNLICIVTILLANTDVWLLWRRKLPINRIKTLSRFALRRLHARATGDSRGTAVSGTHPLSVALFNLSDHEVHVFRILTNFLSFRLITEIISF